jgi:hypothetical protein
VATDSPSSNAPARGLAYRLEDRAQLVYDPEETSDPAEDPEGTRKAGEGLATT